jgi:dipeptidyl aminopeptidase/acylaminoacyl peptidase
MVHSYTADDHLLFQPDAANVPRPTLVLCPGRLGDRASLAWLAEPLATAGFHVCAITYPPERRYLVHDPEQVSGTVDWLQARGLIERDRLGVVGHSRGGAAALLSAARDRRFRAVAALSPLTDNVAYMEALREYAPTRYADLLAGRWATPAEAPDYYKAISALRHADALQLPVLLVHGEMDFMNPHDHSIWLHTALQQAGRTDVRLELIPRAGHFFEQTYNGYAHAHVAARVTEWFQQWLA